MPPTSWKKSPVELIERFATALPEHPAVVRKPMFGYRAAFANGNMVCGCSKTLSLSALARKVQLEQSPLGEHNSSLRCPAEL
jgi:hypothetical protein